MSGKGTPATLLLSREGVPHTVHTYELGDEAGSYGEAVAVALGVEPERMLKTLLGHVDGSLSCAVVPVAGTLDLKAFAAALGGKRAVMAEPAVAERSSGYVVGGISPLGSRTRLPVLVDASVLDLDRVWVSAGRRGLQVSLAPRDLLALTGATTAPLRR